MTFMQNRGSLQWMTQYLSRNSLQAKRHVDHIRNVPPNCHRLLQSQLEIIARSRDCCANYCCPVSCSTDTSSGTEPSSIWSQSTVSELSTIRSELRTTSKLRREDYGRLMVICMMSYPHSYHTCCIFIVASWSAALPRG